MLTLEDLIAVISLVLTAFGISSITWAIRLSVATYTSYAKEQ